MSFVRKPRPYSSGWPGVGVGWPTPAAPPVPARRRERLPRPAPPPAERGPRSAWAGAVSLLALLGLCALLLVGGSGLWNAVARDWQFRSAASGVQGAVR